MPALAALTHSKPAGHYAHTNQDFVDTILITVFCYLFLWCSRSAIGVCYRSHQYHCPLSQKIIIYLNIIQTSICSIVCFVILMRHAMPWIFDCEITKQLSLSCLTISVGCVNGILVAFAFQPSTTVKQEHVFLALAVIAIAVTIGISGYAYVAVEFEESDNGNCYLVARRSSWVLIKLAIDLIVQFGFSFIYLNVVRKIVKDTGMSVYLALLRDGLIGVFLVLFSNILCAGLVATNILSRWSTELYVTNVLVTAAIINWQLNSRHRALSRC